MSASAEVVATNAMLGEMHDIGIDAVLDRIPDGGPYYLTIDAERLICNFIGATVRAGYYD